MNGSVCAQTLIGVDPKLDPNMVTDETEAPAVMIEQANETQRLLKEQTTKMLNRAAEEAIYKQRGLTIDFLNKPIELFKLTCTDSNGDGSAEKMTNPTFTAAENLWEAFCNDPTDAIFSGANVGTILKSAGKCMLHSVLRQQFKKITDVITKFKDMTFCEAFTNFASDQLNQCLKIRFDLPRGQFPGFPGFNQCLFGRLNLTIGGNNIVQVKTSSGALKKVVDNYSAHGFTYSSVDTNSPNGFGGSEQQLLGSDGVSGLMDKGKWRKASDMVKSLKEIQTVDNACDNMDTQLTAALGLWPSPNNLLVQGIPPVIGVNGVKQQRVVATWKFELNPTSKEYEAILYDGVSVKLSNGTVVDPAGGWTHHGTYNYLASCYGFNVDLANTTCSNPDSDSYSLMCDAGLQTTACCNPDKTNCASMNIFWEEDSCQTWSTDKDGKPAAPCRVFYHRKGEIKMPDICAPQGGKDTCCNPAVNDCLQIATDYPMANNGRGVKICPQYVPAKQCLTATPEQLKALDPAYSNLLHNARPKANQMIDGRACCLTEWCNLCPQDIMRAGVNLPAGTDVYIKESELTNVPYYCTGGLMDRLEKTRAEKNPDNTYLETGLVPVPDQIYDNTKEACELMNPGLGPNKKKIEDVIRLFIYCPSTRSSIGIGIIDAIVDGVNNLIGDECPDGGELKPFMAGVIEVSGCGPFVSMTKYPTPLSKIPKVEGAQQIGLCSALPLCPAAIPPEEDPLSTSTGNSGQLDYLSRRGGLEGTLDTMNGTRDRVYNRSTAPRVGGGVGVLRGLGTTPVTTPTRGGTVTTSPRGGGGGTTTPPTTTTPPATTVPPNSSPRGGRGGGSGDTPTIAPVTDPGRPVCDPNQLDAMGFASC